MNSVNRMELAFPKGQGLLLPVVKINRALMDKHHLNQLESGQNECSEEQKWPSSSTAVDKIHVTVEQRGYWAIYYLLSGPAGLPGTVRR